MGFASIIGSIIMWSVGKRPGKPESDAHAERFGIFIGLWAPTFMIVSERLSKYSEEMADGATIP